MRFTVCLLMLLGCSKERTAPAPPALPNAQAGVATAPASAAPDAATAQPAPEPTADGVPATLVAACQAGDAAACTSIARNVAPRGAFRVELSKEEADRRVQVTARHAVRGCELGSGEGCALAAQFDAYSRLEGHLTRACELGFVASCGTLGVHQFDGTGSVAQRRQSAALVERACIANVQDWVAFTSEPGGFCHALFEWYQARQLPRDRAAQARFLDLACQQGYGLDCPCKRDEDCHPEHFCGNHGCAVISTH